MTAKQRAIRDFLRDLESKNNGLLTPEVVVTAARDPSSPIHGEFIWDDAEAAHAFRLNQARELIRWVRYVETTTQVELNAPGYLAVTLPANQHGYMAVDRIKQSKELAREALNSEVTRARAALERARAVADVLGLSAEVEQAITWLANIMKAAA